MTYRATQDYEILHQRMRPDKMAVLSNPPGANAVDGRLVLAPLKIFITLLAFGLTVAFAAQTFSWGNFDIDVRVNHSFSMVWGQFGAASFADPSQLSMPAMAREYLGNLWHLGGPWRAL